MKKVFAFILVLCMVLSCVPTFAEGTTECTHENAYYLTDDVAEHSKYCPDCEKSIEVQTAHTVVCTNGVFTCSVCERVFEHTHSFSETEWTQDTANDTHYRACTGVVNGVACTARSGEANHQRTYSAQGRWDSNGAWYHKAKCDICGYEYGLKRDESKNNNVEDCKDANNDKVCDLCGQELKGDLKKGCENSHSESTSGGQYWTNVSNDNGTHDRVCNDCGEHYLTDPCTPKDGKYTYNENGTHSFVCWCGATITENCSGGNVVSLSYTKGGTTHRMDACDKCKKIYFVACDFKGATCYNVGHCACGNDGGDLLPHTWGAYTTTANTHTHKCTVKGCKASDTQPHDWQLDTATGKYVCSVCEMENACKHNGSTTFIEGEPAGCTTVGVTDSWKCDLCGQTISGGERIAPLNHPNATVTILQEVTCWQDGMKQIKCPDCGANTTETISKETAHNYVKTGCFVDEDGNVTDACAGSTGKPTEKCAAATCTEKGMDHYVCSICGKETHKESKALGHDMSKTVYSNSTTEITDEVTCLKPVYSFTKCSRCGALSTEYKVVKAKGDTAHQFTKTKKITPTCTTPGGTIKYCENVGCTVVDEASKANLKYMGHDGNLTATAPAGGHGTNTDWTKVVVTTKTCTTDGKSYYKCKFCGVRLNAEGVELKDNEFVLDPAEGHKNAGPITECFEGHKDNNDIWTYVKPTCKTNGYWESTCSECDGNYRKVSFADADTNPCNECKASETKHNWVMGAIKTKAVCGQEDGTAQTICSVCKTVAKHIEGNNCLCKTNENCIEHEGTNYVGKDILWKIDATSDGKEHDYQVTSDTYKKPTCTKDGYGYKTCSRCGEKEWFDNIPAVECKGRKLKKVHVPATCTENAYDKYICSVCGDQIGEKIAIEDNQDLATGHDFARAGLVKLCGITKTTVKYVCKNCDYVEYRDLSGNVLEHKVDIKEWARDDFYGKEYLKNFVWKTEVSCKNDGYYLYGACPKCDFVANNAEIRQVAKFHLDTDTYVETTDANCVEPKYEFHKCEECGEEWKVAVGKKLDKTSINDVTGAGHKEWTVVEYIVKETCSETGKGYYGCPYCNTRKNVAEDVPAAHTWSKELIVDKAPTCSEEGYGHKYCTVCAYEATSADNTEGKNDVFNVPIEKTGKCVFTATVVKSGDCTKAGYVVYECAVCHGPADADQIKAAGYEHKVGDGHSVGDDGYLTNHGIVETVHTYKFNDKDKVWEVASTTIKSVEHIVEILPIGSHKWGASEIREATCELPGGLRHTCTVCGTDELVANATATAVALGHDLVCTETPANCYVAGQKVFSCVRCGKTVHTETIAPLAHMYTTENGTNVSAMKEDKTLSVASTCTTHGYKALVCENEGCNYTVKERQPLNPNNHKYVIDSVIREATCTTNGIAFAHCEYCTWDGLYSIAANHNWEVTGVKLAPTCTSKGVNYVKCSVCGATGTQVAKELGHTLVTEAVEASCEETAGIVTYCTVCSYKTNFIKTGSQKLGHAWGAKVYVEATCEKDAHYESTCSRCAKVVSTEIDEDDPYYVAKYDHKGKKLIEKFDGNCMEKAYELYSCPICGENVKVESTINTNGHVWEITFTYGNKEINCGNYGYVDAKCKICGDTVKQKYLDADDLKHSYTENIITDDIVYKVCTVCGDIEIIWTDSNSFTGFKGCLTWNGSKWVGSHKGLVVKASKDATCTEAGELGHIECTVCGTVVREGGVIPAHTTKEVAAVEATCTTDGSTAGTFCLVCNKYVVAPQKIAAKGHKWVDVPAQDATATKPGYTAGIQCENCKEWKEGHEEIPVKAASLKRTAVLRKTAELLGERVALLSTDDAISITGELVNGFYPVSTANGDGYIHNSYIAVA